MTRASPDSWFTKRMMKLTPVEKRFVNSPRQAHFTEKTALALLAQVTLPPRPACLEIGCGQGALARLLVERFGATVIATDRDPDQLAVAQDRLADLDNGVEFRIMDARDIPFDDARFDSVFSFYVLHHITQGWQQAIAGIARVLKPGGHFVFADIVMPSWFAWMARHTLRRLDPIDSASLINCFAEHGLSIVHQGSSVEKFMGIAGVAQKT